MCMCYIAASRKQGNTRREKVLKPTKTIITFAYPLQDLNYCFYWHCVYIVASSYLHLKDKGISGLFWMWLTNSLSNQFPKVFKGAPSFQIVVHRLFRTCEIHLTFSLGGQVTCTKNPKLQVSPRTTKNNVFSWAEF